MKKLKKISAIILAVAMLFSMMSISVFAAEGASVKYVTKFGDVTGSASVAKIAGFNSVSVDVYYSAIDGEDVKAGTMSMALGYDTEVVDSVTFTPNTDDYSDIEEQGDVSAGYWGGYFSVSKTDKAQLFSANKKVGTLKFTFKSEKISSLTTFALNVEEAVGKKEDCKTAEIVDSSNMAFTFTFTDPIQANEVKTDVPAITNKAFGTAKADLGLVEKVTVSTVLQSDGTTAAADKENVVVDWSNATYDPLSKEEQTLEGTLVTDDAVGFKVDGVKVTQKVTLQPVAMSAINVTADVMRKDADDNNAALKEVLPATYTLPAIGEMNDDTVALDWTAVTVAWTGEGSIATIGSTATVTTKVAAGTLSTKGYYKAAADVTVTATVTVIPDNIKGGEIKVNNVGASSKGKVTVTVPAAAIAKLTENDEIVAKFYAYDDTNVVDDTKYKGSSEAYVVKADKITAATGEDGKDLKETLTTAEKMKDLGLGGGTEFAVKVYVNGTLLLNGDTDEYVTAKVLNVSSSPASGIPSGNGGNGGNKDDKKDDAATTPDDYKKDDTATTPDDGDKEDTTPGTDAPATGFNDVPADHWAADFIKVLADAGIINGDEDGNFNTEGKITRAEFTKMVAVLFGLEIKDDATVDFNDCDADDWFVKYVAAAVEAGYINGVGEGTFAPNDTISREDACTILGRALGLAAENANLNFADADAVADYAAQYIALLSELGFINGYEDGTFAPKNEITRAEAAKIIAGIYADKNAAANAGDNTEVEAETETETDAEAEVEEEVEAEK